MYRSPHPKKATVKDVLKDLQEKNIDVTRSENGRQITAGRENSQQQEEVPHRDLGAGNRTQPSAVLDILDI